MDKKYLFFDIDNTLAVWPDGVIPESAQYSLDYLQNTGHHVALATGRLQADAMRFAKMAQTPNFVADGGYSITENYEVQWMQGMDRDRCVQYLKYLTKHHVPWGVTHKNEFVRITPYESILVWNPQWDMMQNEVVPDLMPEDIEHFYKVYAFITEEEEQRRGIVHMTKDLIRYGEGCVLFEPMDKAYGIRKMIDGFGASYQDVVVFGDGYNDLSMFRPDWLNIAMGNGRDALKEKADYVTASCHDDGIYKALQHFGFIPKQF